MNLLKKKTIILTLILIEKGRVKYVGDWKFVQS